MYEAWSTFDSQTEGLAPTELTIRRDGSSSIAWTLGHVTNMLDSWINIRFQGLAPNPVISDANFHMGGSGAAQDWHAVEAAAREVRLSARRFLDDLPTSALDRVIPYTGSIDFLKSTGLRLSYALLRISAHHFLHAGEVAAIRVRLGHPEAGPEPDWGRSLA
jgi:hypothetical protein